ncbi:MAG: PSD1 domain-containing protein, partial [Planctomycetaceae bacterium]|nr:PSD1 domain-containing protein [Planctomycetaceae bacterium]
MQPLAQFLRAGLCLAIVMAASVSCPAVDDNPEAYFEKHVRPLLVRRCFSCHAGLKAGGGLSLAMAAGWQKGGDSGPAIIPGSPEKSLLIDAVNYQTLEMPPADEGGKLSPEEIDILTQWVAMGAPDPRDGSDTLGGMSREEAEAWWAFQPLSPELLHPVIPEDSGRIDTLIETELNSHGIAAAEGADRHTLIRRATYDLTGLPPTAEDVRAFLSDQSPDAFAKVIDRLLASPQYGEHWGRHWLDVVRYADTAGENTDRPLPHAWRYRNWVLDSFRRDLPFDVFARMQIAGDLMDSGSSEQTRQDGIVATGYLAVARRFGHDIDKDIHLTHEDVIDNLGKNFLGLTLGCARCHEHKYDPVTMEDYYALYGVFASTRFSFPGCEPSGQPRDLVALVTPEVQVRLQNEYQQKVAEWESQVTSAAAESAALKQLAEQSTVVLAESPVGEGQAVSLQASWRPRDDGSDATGVVLKKGDVLQLNVLPNGNHGADTTQVQLRISRTDGGDRVWDVEDLIPQFPSSGPAFQTGGATWCLLEVTSGPQFFTEQKRGINGQPDLTAWAIGDTPSSVVNASSNPVSVWTTLPAKSFFIHPGPDRPVAVAWVCPDDGTYHIEGTVTDAHPAGLDGVSFRLEKIASQEYGSRLTALGEFASSQPQRPEAPAIPVAYAVAEAQPVDVPLQQRGDPELPGDVVPRRFLTAFGGHSLGNDGGSGRLALADQIVSHPLFARVMANRIWHWHFGRGLVPTANDFGSRGEPPTHPELLELLAAKFQAGGFRLKPVHRMIMLSRAWQRSSRVSGRDIQKDPGNQWIGRFSRRRMTAEELRDTLLVASEQLDSSPATSHPFPPEASWTFTQHNPFNAVYDTNRRSVYLMVQRQRRHPFLALFDGADPNSSTPARQSTTVPTQALYFLNDPFFHAQARSLATLVLQQPEESQLTFLYQRLFQRTPDAAEQQVIM